MNKCSVRNIARIVLVDHCKCHPARSACVSTRSSAHFIHPPSEHRVHKRGPLGRRRARAPNHSGIEFRPPDGIRGGNCVTHQLLQLLALDSRKLWRRRGDHLPADAAQHLLPASFPLRRSHPRLRRANTREASAVPATVPPGSSPPAGLLLLRIHLDLRSLPKRMHRERHQHGARARLRALYASRNALASARGPLTGVAGAPTKDALLPTY